MPFSFGESINRLADSVLNAPAVSTVARSPLWMALVLTLIIVLIFTFVFRGVEADESFFILGMRSAFWIGALLAGSLFLHNKILLRELDEIAATKAYDGAFAAAYEGAFKPQEPMPSAGLTGLGAMA